MTARTPDAPPADHRLPRYLQIRDELMRRICIRTWTDGQALPAEDKLAAEFSVSLGTMRKALEALVADGMVERIHGRGTFVSRAFERISMLRYVGYSFAQSQQVPDTATRRIEVVKNAGEAAQHLGLRASEKLLYLHRTRSVHGEVLLSEHIWLPHSRFAKLESHLTRHDAPLLYPLYDSLCSVLVAKAADVLTVQPLPHTDALLFKQRTGSAGVRIERCMSEHTGLPIEWRVSYVSAMRFNYAVETR